MKFPEACRAARRTGYTGLEVAPADLSDDPAGLPAERRREFGAIIADSGLTCVGTHSLLAAPKGLHLTTPDAAVRRKSWDYFRRLIDLTADLGTRTVMVLGSSKQRAAVGAPVSRRRPAGSQRVWQASRRQRELAIRPFCSSRWPPIYAM